MNEQEILERVERLERTMKLLRAESKGLCPADDFVISQCLAELGDNLRWAEVALDAERAERAEAELAV